MITASFENGAVVGVEGNICNNGLKYARKELTNPTRTVTSTVKVKDGDSQMLSVKTKEDIPKEKILDCIVALKDLELNAPIEIGEIVLKNVADTGIDIIATKCVHSM
jgi:CxxC motif-containing protein